MKKLLLLFFICTAFNSFSQVRLDYRQVPTQVLYGTIYNASQWANLNDFTNNGVTASVSGNNINISIASGINSSSLDINGYTCLAYWKIFCRYTLNSSTNSTSYGIGVGIRSSAPTDGSMYANFVTNSGDATYSGHLTISSLYPSAVVMVNSTTALSFSNGDSIEVTLRRAANVMYATARNVTTNSAVLQVSYTIPTDVVGAPLIPNTGKFAVFARGGSQIIDTLNVYSNEIVGANLMLLGDSKTVGYYSNYLYRWAAQLQANLNNLVVSAGGGDRTQEVLNRMPEILALKPQTVLIELGTNDQSDSATFKVNYASIVSQLQAAGIVVYHTTFYQTQTDVAWRNNYILRTYPAANIIDCWTPMQVNGALASDAAHPSTLGDSIIANSILSANKFNGITPPALISSGFDFAAPHTYTALQTFNGSTTGNEYILNTFLSDHSSFGMYATSSGTTIVSPSAKSIRFNINATNYATLDASGNFLIHSILNPNTDDLFVNGQVGANSYMLRTTIADVNTFGLYAHSSGVTLATATGNSVRFNVGTSNVGSFSSAGVFIVNALGTGALYSSSGQLTNTNPSDIRLKNSISNYPYGLKEILQLSPKQYYYNSDTKRSDLNAGFLAQDVLKVMPSMVRQMGDGYLGLKSDMIIPALVNAIQELQNEIDYLKKELKKH